MDSSNDQIEMLFWGDVWNNYLDEYLHYLKHPLSTKHEKHCNDDSSSFHHAVCKHFLKHPHLDLGMHRKCVGSFGERVPLHTFTNISR